MKMVRIFIKPAGMNWIDIPMAEGVMLPQVWGAATREGAITCNDAVIPIESVLFAATWLASPQPAGQIVPFTTGPGWPREVVKTPEPPKEGV